MKHAKVLGFCSLVVLSGAALPGQAPVRELKLGNAGGFRGQTVDVPLSLTSGSEVQGLVAAADWDGAKLQGVNLINGPALTGADVVVPRVEPGFVVLGVVMDSDGQGGEVIPPGTDTLVATLQLRLLGPSGAVDETAPLIFQDAKYNTATGGGPPLENIIVVGSLSIGRAEGLVLTSGLVTLRVPPPGAFRIQDTLGLFGARASVPVILDLSEPVQGFVTAITHPPGITLTGIEVGTAASAADFSQPELFPNGGTLGVVMDLFPPFTGPTIPPGSGNEIARYVYGSAPRPDTPAEDTEDFALSFSDFTLGDPLKENVIVVLGRSRNPSLTSGVLTLRPPINGDGFFLIAVGGSILTGPKDAQAPAQVVGHPGEMVQVGLWYKSPEDNEPDEAEQTDHIQGISMAVCYDSAFISCKGTFSLEGTITQAVDAEFVNVHCLDSRPASEPLGPRGGELVAGILVDALPPFLGQDLPPTEAYLKLLCVDFQVNRNAPCNECSPISFCDGAVGAGKVPVRNLASVMNESVRWGTVNGEVCTLAEPTFIRGDCNSSDGAADQHGPVAVDISDAAAVIGFLFLTGSLKFDPQCLDACDANDDGRVDLADSVYVLRFLFKENREPKPPYPNPGVDPTGDKLTCTGGSVCL